LALQAFLDTFAMSTGAAGTTQARTGYGFQPKALIVFGTTNTTASDVVTGGAADLSIGFAVSPTSRLACSCAANDNVATSDTARSSRADAVYVVTGSGGSQTAWLDIDSFDADGVTFIVDDASTSARILHVLALGGADLTNAFVSNFAAATSGATQAVTGVGFRPDAILLLSIANTTAGTVVTSHALFSLGVVGAAGAANNACVAIASQDAQASTVSKSYCRNGESLVGWATAATINGRGYVSSLDADGFTVTWNANPSAAHVYYFLAIKGGQFSVGDVTTVTDTTTDITEAGLAFQPVAGVLLSHNKTASTAGTVQADSKLSFGAFTGASAEQAVSVHNADAISPSQVGRGAEFDASYMNISTSDTLDGAMHLTSVNSGGYTARMANADPSAAFVAHLLFGSTAGASAARAQTYNRRRRAA
jgi:hypothetical protein